MIDFMRSRSHARWLSGVLATLLLLAMATPALAQKSRTEKAIEDAESVDGRFQLYDQNEGTNGVVALEDGSRALTYVALICLTALCVSVMFKNPKRSHLD